MRLWHNSNSDRQALFNYLTHSLHPYAAPTNETGQWLKLARIYREAGRRIEYLVLAEDLLDTFGLRIPSWTETWQ